MAAVLWRLYILLCQRLQLCRIYARYRRGHPSPAVCGCAWYNLLLSISTYSSRLYPAFIEFAAWLDQDETFDMLWNKPKLITVHLHRRGIVVFPSWLLLTYVIFILGINLRYLGLIRTLVKNHKYVELPFNWSPEADVIEDRGLC